MAYLVALLLAALCVLHHDLWWWADAEPLVLGFMPVGLAWHLGISIAAGIACWLAVVFCWPQALVEADAADADEGAQ